MYENLKNTIIDTKKEEYKDFPKFLEGHIFIEYDNGFVTQEPIVIPQTITMRQARLQLLDEGLLDDIESFINNDRKYQIEFEYATTVERSSPLIEAIKVALGLTNEQIDEMFLKASKL